MKELVNVATSAEIRRRRRGCAGMAAIALGVIIVAAKAAETKVPSSQAPADPTESRKIPVIKLDVQPPIGKEEAERILRLIDHLTNIDSQNSASLPAPAGVTFAPLGTTRRVSRSCWLSIASRHPMIWWSW